MKENRPLELGKEFGKRRALGKIQVKVVAVNVGEEASMAIGA